MEIIIVGLLAGLWGFLLGTKTKEKPAKPIPEPKPGRELVLEQTRLETILKNIENYDGTGFGQEDLPGR